MIRLPICLVHHALDMVFATSVQVPENARFVGVSNVKIRHVHIVMIGANVKTAVEVESAQIAKARVLNKDCKDVNLMYE